ncbi:MAG: hypothetical protein ACPG9N_06595, partial [Miltoncostaeaceae bacterium]
VVGTQLLLALFVGTRVQREVEAQLQQQGAQIAQVARTDGYAGIAEARRYLPGTRVVVRQGGQVVYWSDPVQVLEARAVVADGDIEVTMERQADAGVWGEWAVPVVTGGAVLGWQALPAVGSDVTPRRSRGRPSAWHPATSMPAWTWTTGNSRAPRRR